MSLAHRLCGINQPFCREGGCHKPLWGRVKFSAVVNQARALLHSKGRITHRARKHEFDLDDEAREDRKEGFREQP
jgi:hypothetical protein